MKRLLMLLAVTCSIESQLASIRPGAQYVIHSGDYAGIEWTDKVQAKPTPQEMSAALADCQEQLVADAEPSLEDRMAAIEQHQADQDLAIQAVATKTSTSISLSTAEEVP